MSSYETSDSDVDLDYFYELCRTQDVGLDDLLLDKDEWIHEDICYAPSHILRAVAIAGQELRKNHGKLELAKKEIELPADFVQVTPDQVALGSLVKIVNCTVKPPSEMPPYQFFSGDLNTSTTCSTAEEYFKGSLKHMANSIDANLVWIRFQIIHDGHTAVGFRKKMGNPTVMFFRQWASDGIIYPPGSIAALKTNQEEMPRIEIDSPRLINVNDVDKVAFLRLTTMTPREVKSYGATADQWLKNYMSRNNIVT